jgi:hypothetical protein
LNQRQAPHRLVRLFERNSKKTGAFLEQNCCR